MHKIKNMFETINYNKVDPVIFGGSNFHSGRNYQINISFQK